VTATAAPESAGWNYVRPRMYRKQNAAIFEPKRFSVIEATTKSGKSSSALVWLCEQAFRQTVPGRNVWWVAPVYTQSRIMFERLRRKLPAHMIETNQTELTIRLIPNDCKIWFKSGERPDSLYGDDVYAAVLDEFSRMREEAWFAIRSTLTATKAPARLIGNVRGRGWAWKLARRAEKGDDPELAYHKITAWDAVDAGVLEKEEIEAAQRILPEMVFRELYLAEAADDGSNPFGLEHIEACCVNGLSVERVAAWGIDLARKRDWTVLVGLDRWGKVAHFERFQKPWPEQISIVRELVGGLPAYVDATGVGDPVVQLVQRPVGPGELRQDAGGYRSDDEGSSFGFAEKLSWGDMTESMREEAQRNADALHRTFGDTQIEGYLFTNKSKQGLMESLAVAIQQRTVRFPREVVPGVEHPIKLELESFEYQFGKTQYKYCVAPDTRVMTADLRWVPVASLAVGDAITAFDEYALPENKSRCWRQAFVQSTGTITRPCYRLILDDGTSFISSAEHKWLVKIHGTLEGETSRSIWRRTDELRAPHPTSTSFRYASTRLSRLVDVWDTATSYDAGYLAAAFDGEGSLIQSGMNGTRARNVRRLTVAQSENAMFEEIQRILTTMNFPWYQVRSEYSVKSLILKGRCPEFLRFLGQVRPKRLLSKLSIDKIGTLECKSTPSVVALEYVGEQEVTAIGTTTGTLICEGIASHNSAPDGEHDDCVMALGLAVKCLHDRVASATADVDLAGLVEGFAANSLWDLGVGSEGSGKWNIGR
jgi:hypothetical protein